MYWNYNATNNLINHLTRHVHQITQMVSNIRQIVWKTLINVTQIIVISDASIKHPQTARLLR